MEWIDVNDEFPPLVEGKIYSDDVLIAYADGDIEVAYMMERDGKTIEWMYYEECDMGLPTHWMPLPLPPSK